MLGPTVGRKDYKFTSFGFNFLFNNGKTNSPPLSQVFKWITTDANLNKLSDLFLGQLQIRHPCVLDIYDWDDIYEIHIQYHHNQTPNQDQRYL